MSPQPADSAAELAKAAPRCSLFLRLGWLVCLLSGASMALAFPPYDFGNWVWAGLLPFLSVLWLGERGFRRGFFHGWLYGMGWYCVSFWWIHNVGYVFRIPQPIFLAIAFFPLMSVYALLVGLWGGIANTLLRPRLEEGPATESLPFPQKKEVWAAWAHRDLLSTLRAALGGGALWVCIEWMRASGTLGFSWNSLGMGLYNGLSMVQWAEYVGTAALSFLPASTAIILWGAFRRTWKHFHGVGKGCPPWDFYGMAIILFGLFLGGLALSKAYSPTRMMQRESVLQLPVMGVQINIDQRERIEGGPMQPGLYGEFLRTTRSAFEDIQRNTIRRAMKNPEIGIIQQLPVWVVWPESAMGTPLQRNLTTGQLLSDGILEGSLFSPNGLPLVREQVQQLGGQSFVLFSGVDEYLWEPLPEDSARARYRGMSNSMAFIPAGAESISTVSKQHLMPFGEYIPYAENFQWISDIYAEMTGTQIDEGIRPGTGDMPIPTPVPGTNETVGVIPAICYEDTVGPLLTKFVRKEPQVIINITNDAWFRDSACGVQQARNAAFRCIELRRPMVRAANMGLTCAIAPNGALIHALRKADGSPHMAGYSYAVLPVDREAGYTLFALLGNWAVGVCGVLALGTSIPGRRRKP